MEAQLNELKSRLLEVADLGGAYALLSWDQTTYMPPAGAAPRGRQIALLTRLAHERATDPALGRLLEELRPYEESLPADSQEAALIRVARYDYERNTRLPPEFMAEMIQHTSQSYEAWTKARPANDFAQMRPYLERTLEFSRRFVEFFPGYDHIADPLIDFSDMGMKAANIRTLFESLRKQLVPLVRAITEQPVTDSSCLHRHYPEDKQWNFGIGVIKDFGFDLERGRQDRTHHPYMTKFAHNDVRITTRFRADDIGDGLFSTLHECGHALYELGIDQNFDGSPLDSGVSAGVHESQSRLWENIVGRSRGFWQHFYPQLQAVFPEQLNDVPLDTFYRAINKVERSLIRVDADEVTYNLHVMIRFDLELDLLEGKLAVRDLPEAWRERYRSDLGIVAPDDRDGVLQDVHWFHGLIGGAFQGYTLGNILSAQFYEAAVRAHPEIPQQIGRGEFATLHTWLRENIYQHGRAVTPDQLIVRASGQPLTIEPYMRYLRTKYGELYSL